MYKPTVYPDIFASFASLWS